MRLLAAIALLAGALLSPFSANALSLNALENLEQQIETEPSDVQEALSKANALVASYEATGFSNSYQAIPRLYFIQADLYGQAVAGVDCHPLMVAPGRRALKKALDAGILDIYPDKEAKFDRIAAALKKCDPNATDIPTSKTPKKTPTETLTSAEQSVLSRADDKEYVLAKLQLANAIQAALPDFVKHVDILTFAIATWIQMPPPFDLMNVMVGGILLFLILSKILSVLFMLWVGVLKGIAKVVGKAWRLLTTTSTNRHPSSY